MSFNSEDDMEVDEDPQVIPKKNSVNKFDQDYDITTNDILEEDSDCLSSLLETPKKY